MTEHRIIRLEAAPLSHLGLHLNVICPACPSRRVRPLNGMSFEAFVYCFREGEPAGVSRQRVRDAFSSFLTEGGAYDWHLHYGESDNCDVMLGVDDADHSLLRSFTVLRPCGDVRFWDTMASILRFGNLVLFFPASCPPLVADSSVAPHLPSNMIESMGQPKCVATGQEILDALHAA